MKFRCLTIEERAATGMTHRLDFDVSDIPAGIATATAQTFNTAPLPVFKAGMIVKRSQVYLTVPLAPPAGQPTFNTTTLSIGDTGTATKFINAVQINENGTEVITTFPGTENQIYTADTQMSLTLGAPPATFSLSGLIRGKFYVLMAIDAAADPAKTVSPPFTGGGYT